ncbi:sensor domain-containing diguanylate cyclase [Paraglaciecola psychrophila]|uniref:diguanylate cyclase n=1 Tax=Paraglaciecola psychrophila 170 TaxID=1129794 RepID=K6Z553_9ALTE|nr:diguanylate cyclase [Paraglaciecola psychrophila]AGH47039.1 diguanylate cyclase [Paraglaciecola psychrophila 170]GAC40209.1 diguanylate cyclase [Paraglaciecola psychrophila 170]
MAVDSSLAEMHWKHDLLGSIEVGIVVLDKDFNVQVWNQFMENHSSIVPGMIQNKNLFEFFPEIDEEWFTRKAAPAFSLKSPVFIIWEQRPYLFHFDCNRPITSQANHMYQNITIFPLASLTGKVEQVCLVIYDVTDEAVSRLGMQSLNSQLEKVSRVDGLTGLYNRRFWEEQFVMEYKRDKRSESPSALIMLDIDNFKKVNDTYGHPAGDEVIKTLAGIIKKATRETDLAGRYGGEEFAVILPDTPVANVEFVAERVRRLVEKCVVVHDEMNISFTVSIGIAGFKHTYKDSTQWLDMADKSLYQAKAAGKNRVILAE